ncbi:hypothetical protein [Chitinophaga sp. sic0106]|uniref:hypothetical protein n=1 Tax=Chitinophaga sp. sic0106 TaxID=2854785 RepID=UPI001C44D0E9|nr:hypothetical protein [Chitinophaga sp. sic0106]MBV7530630.1 hypothetical protein [Chitinophaga sp. sic0106]
MKAKNNLKGLEKKVTPLKQNEQGKLKGGFSAFGATEPVKTEPVNVNVDVASGHTCACACK